MTEQEKCIQEAHRIEACEGYFKARHEMLHTITNERCFEAGFDRGWQAAIASREPMPLEKAEELAHVTAWDYKHAQGGRPNFYIFDANTLEQLIRKAERFHGIGE